VIPYASTTRRAAGKAVTLIIVALAGVLGVATMRAFDWNPFAGAHLPKVHLPAVSQTVQGPSESTLILQHLQAIGVIHAEDATYNWGLTVSSAHRTLGFTTGRSKHSVALVAKVPIGVDVSHAGFAIPRPEFLVLMLPPPVPGVPTIDPTAQTQVDSCETRLPVLGGLATVDLNRSCAADALKYQAQAIADITKQSQHDPAVVDAARLQTAQLIACLVQPTGWSVGISWTDQPFTVSPPVASCPSPMTDRLPPVPTTVPATTGATP